MRALLSALGGAAATLVLVLSCSDDSPQDVDAATNCEPPLAGRITRIEAMKTNETGTLLNVAAGCPAGAMLLGGGCEVAGPFTERLVLYTAGFGSASNAYGCAWNNPSAVTAETIKSWAVCLMPAS